MFTNDMIITKFHKFLTNLGYSETDLSGVKEDFFTYSLGEPLQLNVSFFYTNSKDKIFNIHRSLWNENRINTFIAVEDNATHIINAKVKPDINKPLVGGIASFDYGVNTDGFDKGSILELTKEYLVLS